MPSVQNLFVSTRQYHGQNVIYIHRGQLASLKIRPEEVIPLTNQLIDTLETINNTPGDK